jgi:hypothetical protein
MIAESGFPGRSRKWSVIAGPEGDLHEAGEAGLRGAAPGTHINATWVAFGWAIPELTKTIATG